MQTSPCYMLPESISVSAKVQSSTILTQNKTASYICATKVTEKRNKLS